MNKDNAKQFLPLVQALADGKTIQHLCNGWEDLESVNFSYTPETYRIKPEPKLRPWKPEEVPVGAQFRLSTYKPDKVFEIVGSGVAGNEVFSAPALFLSYREDAWVPGTYYYLTDCITSTGKPEHSLDRGKTWQPCGVLEDAQ